MMNYKLKSSLILMFLFVAGISAAQKDTVYFDSRWDKSSKADATYFRVVEKQGDKFLVKDMYLKSCSPQMIALCTNTDAEPMKNGKCTYYLENGLKESEGEYKQNKKTGIWVDWYDGGKDSSVTDYRENGTVDYIRVSEKEKLGPDGKPFDIVEKMPVYPGGYGAMAAFLQKNIQFPKKCTECASGTCYVTFYVDTDGSLKDVHVLRGIPNGAAYDREAVRVVKMMPNWEPGTQNDKKVRVQFNLPIKFK